MMHWELVVAILALCLASAVLARTEYRLWRDGRVWPYKRRPGRDYW